MMNDFLEMYDKTFIIIFTRLLNVKKNENKTILVPTTERSRALLSWIYKTTNNQEDLWNNVIIRDKNDVILECSVNENKEVPILLFTDILEDETDLMVLYTILRENSRKVDLFSLKETIQFWKNWENELKKENGIFEENNFYKDHFNNYIKELKENFTNSTHERYHLNLKETSSFIISLRNFLKRKNEFTYGLPINFTAKIKLEQWNELISKDDYIYIENCEKIFNNNETNENFFYKNNSNNAFNKIPNSIHLVNHYKNGEDIIAKFGCVIFLPQMNKKIVNEIINILYDNFPIEIFEKNNIRVTYKYVLWYISLFYGYYQTEIFSNYIKQFGEVTDIELDFISDKIKNCLQNISLQEKDKRWTLVKNNILCNCHSKTINFSDNKLLNIYNNYDNISDFIRFGLLSSSYNLEDIDKLLSYQQDTKKKLEFLKSILCMLSRQEIDIDLYISKYEETYTIFKKGIDSNIFVGKDIDLIFPFIFAYNARCDEFLWDDKYDSFIEWLKAYFFSKNYIDNLITRKCFNFFTEYFRNGDKRLIFKQAYLLDNGEKSKEYRKIYSEVLNWRI